MLLLLITCSLASSPSISLFFTSEGDALTNRAVTWLDASLSAFSAPLFFSFDFGQGFCSFPLLILPGPTPLTPVSRIPHTFEEGEHCVRVIASDRNDSFTRLSSGLPTSTLLRCVHILAVPAPDCYSLQFSLDNSPMGEGIPPFVVDPLEPSTYILRAQMVDPHETTFNPIELTHRFASLGQQLSLDMVDRGTGPVCSFSAPSFFTQPDLSSTDPAWSIEITVDSAPCSRLAKVEAYGKTLALGCRLQTTTVLSMTAEPQTAYPSITNASALLPSSLSNIVQDACSPSTAILPIGSVFLLTGDLFRTYRGIDPHDAMCSALASPMCSVTILSIAISIDGLVIGSDKGLFWSSWHHSDLVHIDVADGDLISSFKLWSPTRCVEQHWDGLQESFVYALFTTQSDGKSHLAYSPRPGAHSWEFIDVDHRVLSVTRDTDRCKSVILVGHTNGTSASIQFYSEGGFSQGFAFPSSISLHSLHGHADGETLIAWGQDGLWLSIDGGASFVQSSHKHIQAVTSTLFSFSATDSDGMLLLGKSGVKKLATTRLPTNTDSLLYDAKGLLIALADDLSRTNIPTLSAIHHSKSAPAPPNLVLVIRDTPGDMAVMSWDSVVEADVADGGPIESGLDQSSYLQTLRITSSSAIIDVSSLNGATEGDSGISFDCHVVSQQPTLKGHSLRLEATAAVLTTAGSHIDASLEPFNSSHVGWVASDVGKTIQALSGTCLILRVISAERVRVRVVHRLRMVPSDSPLVDTWTMHDWRPFDNAAASEYGQSLTVPPGASSGAQVEVTLTVGFLQFDNQMLNMILEVSGDGWGVIVDITDPVRATVVVGADLTAATVSSGHYSIYSQGDDDAKRRVWTVGHQPCAYDALLHKSSNGVTSDLDGPLVEYLDTSDSAQLSVLISPPEEATIDLRASNSDLFSVRSSDEFAEAMGRSVRGISMSVHEAGGTGTTSLVAQPRDTSLRCPRSAVRWRVVVDCPPDKELSWPTIDPSLWLQSDIPLDNSGVEMLVNIPVNYRPPSSSGRAIPTSDAIYNADPSKPKHMNLFRVSQRTGRYKQCKGKSSHDACECTSMQKVSQLIADSDCSERAMRLSFSEIFTPQFTLLPDEADVVSPYSLMELNGREDWFIVDATTANQIDPKANGQGIEFQGTELYHFRALSLQPSHCNLVTEFKVWVSDAPFVSAVLWQVVGITAVTVSLMLLGVYCVYSRKSAI